MAGKLEIKDNCISFRCPGCDSYHTINQGWKWNGSHDRPTFTPSILEKSGHYARPGEPCWCTYNAEYPDNPSSFKCHICHSFVTDGKIQFLGDCTHEKAGQTLEIPDWE